MIEILKIMRDEMTKRNFCVNAERVRTNLEIRRAHAMFFEAFKGGQGDESKSKPFMERFRFPPSQMWDRRDRGSWQPNTHARTKVTRMKVGKSI